MPQSAICSVLYRSGLKHDLRSQSFNSTSALLQQGYCMLPNCFQAPGKHAQGLSISQHMIVQQVHQTAMLTETALQAACTTGAEALSVQVW